MGRRNKKGLLNQAIEEPKEETKNIVEKESIVFDLKIEAPEEISEDVLEEVESPEYNDDGVEDGDTDEMESEDVLDAEEEVKEEVPVIKKGHADLRMNRRLGIF